MNTVENEETVSALAKRPFDAAEFAFAFLETFGNNDHHQAAARQYVEPIGLCL